ncbi:MAG: hypothetical protein RLZ95_460 [Bacteroidota bacterium]|jgi:Ig-like domain CHU_C associated
MLKSLLKGLVAICFFVSPFFAQSQSQVSGVIKGLKQGDTAIVKIQKNAEAFYFKKIGGIANNADVAYSFPNLSIGKWAISIDAKGYLFPPAKVLDLNNNNIDLTITLTPATIGSTYNYTWQDDSSFVGHAQQAYINDKVEINVLGKAEKVPDDFNAINALNEYGFLFSDDSSKWTSEDAYRLYQTLKKLNFRKYGENDSVKVKAKWILTDRYIDRDIDFTTVNGIDIITISRAAFTYATPQVVTVDGVKGKFFSKRLYTALVYYYSDKGINKDRIAEIAKTRYGFEFLAPSPFLKTLMNETETNFQEFTSDEKIIILSMFEEFPDAMQRQGELKYMVRRVNGQSHPVYPTAPAIAWVTNNNIEWMEGAFISQDITYMQRLVLHEKAHFLWEYIFDKTTQDDWSTLGGWFKDPTSGSGWSTTNTTEFVSAYAHLKNPNEDMAESIAFYITNPEALRSRSLRKFEFIRDRIMKGTRYISVIRPDLTFQVYNLFPDYNYPGKIKRTKLEVIGEANEDKKVVLEIELTVMNKAFDGADWASCRFTSSIGTIKDMGLFPVNAQKSILRGEMTLSKFAKSGYWIIPQMTIGDVQGNMRLENNSTYGVKCFVNNPLEDVTPPLYVQNSLKLDSVSVKVKDFGGGLAQGADTVNLQPSNAIKLSFKMIEKNTINPDGRVLARMYLPTFDSTNKYNIQPYSFDCQIGGTGILNDKPDSLKTAQFYFPVPDYFPSGYYSVSYIDMQDVALNVRQLLLDKDTANKNYFIAPRFVNQRAIRDSVYMKTKYPDLKPPVIDLNDIKIQATPTNPSAPNGETLFEMWLWIKDESDYAGKASGFANGYYTLRDPQGLERSISMQSDLGNLFYTIQPDSSIYGYKRYYFKTLLPAGSPPGLWGVSAININDHAQNRKYYSFVEYVRFDVDQSNVLQVTPYVEILGKKVNSKNVDSVAVKIGCASCKDQKYRLRMYSSMGGSSPVFEGKMTKDTVTLTNLNLKGVNDGVLYATVFMLDSASALIGTGRATYTKDVVPPKSAIIQSNISNFGKSNLDSLIIDMKVNELNCDYNIVLTQKSIVKTNALGYDQFSIKSMSTSSFTSAVGDSVVLAGKLTDSVFKLKNINLNAFQDGLIEIKVIVLDSMGNEIVPIKNIIYKDTKDPVITIKKSSTTDLKAVYTVESNEYISNTLTKENLSIGVGAIDSVKKVSNTLYNVYITRICNDTVNITVKANALLDTVGNKNAVSSISAIEKLIPEAPATANLSLCTGISASTLTATALNGHSLVWYNAAANGTPPLSASPVPPTSSAGTTNYYVAQTKTATGCESAKSKLTITVNSTPGSPTLSRDTANYLVSSATKGNIWYKDGVAIQDTTAKFKPTTSGAYTAKTMENGCISATSATYYFLVTDIVNLSANEFIKLAPNPFKNKINLDFVVKGYPQLNIEVFELSTGARVLSKQNISAGTGLFFDQLSAGTYLFRVSSNDLKIIQQFKIIKL